MQNVNGFSVISSPKATGFFRLKSTRKKQSGFNRKIAGMMRFFGGFFATNFQPFLVGKYGEFARKKRAEYTRN